MAVSNQMHGRRIKGVLFQVYDSVSSASEKLNIPKRVLLDVCYRGELDKLKVQDLKKIAPLLPEEWRDDLRDYVLP